MLAQLNETVFVNDVTPPLLNEPLSEAVPIVGSAEQAAADSHWAVNTTNFAGMTIVIPAGIKDPAVMVALVDAFFKSTFALQPVKL